MNYGNSKNRKVNPFILTTNIPLACYFNSLIQTYFFIPKFMETIMNYRSPTVMDLSSLSQER